MVVPPDHVLVARRVLTAPGVLPAGVTVSTDLVGFQLGMRWVRLTATGGSAVDARRLFAPRVDAACYAESQNAARLLCLSVYGALLDAVGIVGAGVVSAVTSETFPIDSPDEVDEAPRAVCAVRMYLRPADGGVR